MTRKPQICNVSSIKNEIEFFTFIVANLETYFYEIDHETEKRKLENHKFIKMKCCTLMPMDYGLGKNDRYQNGKRTECW